LRDILVGDRNGYIMLYIETPRAGLHLADTLKANGVNIMVNYNANPEVNDWNQDGRKDLIVGEESYLAPNTGNIRVYLNSGTNANPVFTTYSVISAGGSQIYQYRVTPRIFDLDRDGLKDLVVGQGDALVFFYRNVGTNAAPVFNAAYDTLKTTNGLPINAYYGSRIYLADWRGDNDPDLLISGYDGYVELYENATIVSVEESNGSTLVSTFRLLPNPVTDRVALVYSLTKQATVHTVVYSADGRMVAALIDRNDATGDHQITWDLTDDSSNKIPSGVYFIRFTAGSEQHTERLTVTR